MSNANRNMLGTAVHAFDHFGCHMPWASCGKPVRHASTARAAVTCKRCLASLAKRDRHFRARARAGLRRSPLDATPAMMRGRSWRAIAREEGRFFSVYVDGRPVLGGDVTITRAREYARETGGYVVGPDGVREVLT